MSVRQTVLIVENDQPTRQMYRRTLEQEYLVLSASVEDDVSTLVKTHTIHAIVLEPGPISGGGWALLADLKHDSRLQAVPIIICTAQDERRLGLELGSTAYLVKPVLPAVLLETVRRLTHPETTYGGLA
jgi:DNA-binding response OmpR family regulator